MGRFDEVEVRNRFDGNWAAGFEVAGRDDGPPAAYRLRRRSDGVVLPATFAEEEVRPVEPGQPH